MEKKYRITMTETQLRLMIDAVEDWHRFLAGDCRMDNATSYIENASDMHLCRRLINEAAHPFIVPEYKYSLNSAHKWSGIGCPRENQRKAITMSYMLYREPLHHLIANNGEDMSWCAYNGETLTCPEQGELIKIEEVTQEPT